MNDRELIVPVRDVERLMLDRATTAMERCAQMMMSMSDTMRGMSERIDQLERELSSLIPLTASQTTALCGHVRSRANRLASEYKLGGGAANAIAAAIRKSLKQSAGVRCINDLPRIDWDVYLERVRLWDDYNAMRSIRQQYRDP